VPCFPKEVVEHRGREPLGKHVEEQPEAWNVRLWSAISSRGGRQGSTSVSELV
jgi:hypothetical protein